LKDPYVRNKSLARIIYRKTLSGRLWFSKIGWKFPIWVIHSWLWM